MTQNMAIVTMEDE